MIMQWPPVRALDPTSTDDQSIFLSRLFRSMINRLERTQKQADYGNLVLSAEMHLLFLDARKAIICNGERFGFRIDVIGGKDARA